MSKWRDFANIIGAPYNKCFSTDFHGDFIINSDGLYQYDKNTSKIICFKSEDNYLSDFLSGKIKVIYLNNKEEQNKKAILRLKDCSSCVFEEDSFMHPYDYPCRTCREIFS